MPLLPLSQSPQADLFALLFKRPWGRLLLLCLLLLVSISMNVLLALSAPPPDSSVTFFIVLLFFSYVPYLVACLLVLFTKPQAGRWLWREVGVILFGAFVLRAMLLYIPPDLSHDSWRYLWDARVTLHGYSPYVYAPGVPLLQPLRDFLYVNSRFRNVPTIYPPGAQAIFLLSYLIAPSNLFVLKAIFLLFDLVTCLGLIYLLVRRGLDPARVIIYAWCPLPIIEFAIQGHLDVITLTFTILMLVCSMGKWRGARVLTGFLLAMATLTKIYPILFLVVVWRRRDWALLITCFATIIVSYVPYLILGHGQVFGFFSTYTSEYSPNAGVLQHVIVWIGAHVGLSQRITTILQYMLDVLFLGSIALMILLLRWRERISKEMAILALVGAFLAASTHIFPWYTTAFLPWIALLIGPVWTRQNGLQATEIAVAMAWYLACLSPLGYLFVRDWTIYYLIVYDVVLLGLGVAAVVGIRHIRAAHSINLKQ